MRFFIYWVNWKEIINMNQSFIFVVSVVSKNRDSRKLDSRNTAELNDEIRRRKMQIEVVNIFWPKAWQSKMTVYLAKTQLSLGIHPVWWESSLSDWRKTGSLPTYKVHSEDSDKTGQMLNHVALSLRWAHRPFFSCYGLFGPFWEIGKSYLCFGRLYWQKYVELSDWLKASISKYKTKVWNIIQIGHKAKIWHLTIMIIAAILNRKLNVICVEMIPLLWTH